MSARSDAENRSPRAFGSRFEEKSRMNDAGTSDSNSPDDGKKSSAAGGLSSLLSAAASSNPTHTTVSNAIGTLFLITGPAASGKKTLFKGSFEETLHESPNYALSKR